MKNEVKIGIKKIIEEKERNRLVIFAGGGVSRNSDIPLWWELVDRLRNDGLSISDKETDLLKIAQLYLNQRGEKEYYEAVQKILKHKKATYNSINEIIVKLNPQHIITTNYDNLFEQIIDKEQAQYDVIRKDADFPNTQFSKYLIKMHGCFECSNIVLTEDDYLNYSTNFPLIENFVKGIFASRLVLFVGFSFTDINLKYILQKVEAILGKKKQPAYILLIDDYNETEKDYLRKKRIQPIYYDEIKEYIESSSKISKLKKLNNEKGNSLLKFLELIHEPPFDKDETEKLPIIKQIYQSILPFQDFGFIMPSVYERLEPFKVGNLNSPRLGYYTDKAQCLFVKNPLIEEILEKLTNIDTNGKSQRKIKTLNKLQLTGSKEEINGQLTTITNGAIFNEDDYNEMIDVLEKLNASRISCINGKFDVWVESDSRGIDCQCLSCIYNRFEFDKLFELFDKLELSNKEISDTDKTANYLLLKGHIANKIGLSKLAFKAFIEASESAKIHEKPVLLFLAKHNLKYIYQFIDDDENSGKIAEGYGKNIDLQDLLNGLKVSREVREELDNIKNEKYLHEYTAIVRKSRDKIIDDYTFFENGGGTTRKGDIYNLIANFVVLHHFYEKNYLIDTEYSPFKKFIEICFESIVYNYITSPTKQRYWHDNYDRLKSIDPFFIQSVVLYASSDKLLEILLKLRDKKINVTDYEGRKRFIDCVVHFLKSFYVKPSWGGTYANKEVMNRVGNLSPFSDKCRTIFANFILLLGKIDFTDTEFSITIQPLIYFLSVETFLQGQVADYWQFYLETNIKRYQKERQKQLLTTFLDKKNIRKNLIVKTAYEIQQMGNILYEDVLEIEKLYNNFENRDRNTIFELYSISNPEVKQKITEKSIELLSSEFDLDDFYNVVRLKILPAEHFLENAIQEIAPHLNTPFDNESSYFKLPTFLCFISRNRIDTSGNLFIPFIENSDYISWLLRYDNFDYSNFKSEWFGYQPTITFLPLMAKNKDVKKHLELYLKNNTGDNTIYSTRRFS